MSSFLQFTSEYIPLQPQTDYYEIEPIILATKTNEKPLHANEKTSQRNYFELSQNEEYSTQPSTEPEPAIEIDNGHAVISTFNYIEVGQRYPMESTTVSNFDLPYNASMVPKIPSDGLPVKTLQSLDIDKFEPKHSNENCNRKSIGRRILQCFRKKDSVPKKSNLRCLSH